MSMEDKIKKQIEEEALRRFPEDEYDDEYFTARYYFKEGAKYGYSIKESVNEKLVKATQKLLDEIVFNGVYFKNHTLVQDVILTASNQENNEGWINFTKTSPKEYGRYLVYRGGKIHFETWNNTGWAYNHNSITHWKQINPPKEK